jgi:hypothetical protein
MIVVDVIVARVVVVITEEIMNIKIFKSKETTGRTSKCTDLSVQSAMNEYVRYFRSLNNCHMYAYIADLFRNMKMFHASTDNSNI